MRRRRKRGGRQHRICVQAQLFPAVCLRPFSAPSPRRSCCVPPPGTHLRAGGCAKQAQQAQTPLGSTSTLLSLHGESERGYMGYVTVTALFLCDPSPAAKPQRRNETTPPPPPPFLGAASSRAVYYDEIPTGRESTQRAQRGQHSRRDEKGTERKRDRRETPSKPGWLSLPMICTFPRGCVCVCVPPGKKSNRACVPVAGLCWGECK
jgi:hypothetical protein